MRLPQLAGTALLALAAATGPARAAYTVTFSQVGPDVVASGSGMIDTKGLAFDGTGDSTAGLLPRIALELTGPSGPSDLYYGPTDGPRSFGPGGPTSAITGTGDLASASATNNLLLVLQGYASGAPLSDTATYAGQTFTSLGLPLGVYVYSFGADTDTFTVNVGGAAPGPKPASVALLGAGLLDSLGMASRRPRRLGL